MHAGDVLVLNLRFATKGCYRTERADEAPKIRAVLHLTLDPPHAQIWRGQPAPADAASPLNESGGYKRFFCTAAPCSHHRQGNRPRLSQMKAVRKAQLSVRPPRRTNILDFDALSGPSPINRRPPLSPDDSTCQPAVIAEATFQRRIDAAAALHYAVRARYQTAAPGQGFVLSPPRMSVNPL